MGSSTSLLVTTSSFITGSIAFILEVALLVVALTVVRKRRTDASALIAASAGVHLVLTVVSPIAYALIARTTGVGSSYVEMSVLLQLGFTVFRAVAMVLLILGVVRLASDPSPSASPYGAGY
jgi:hypothetical protein